MCTILSHEKCSCFLLLVILAVLSCSGFHIDNIPMTDISKRNSHTSFSLVHPQGLYAATTTAVAQQHRIRHQRQLSQTQHTKNKRRMRCSEPDVSYKAYKANAVVRATVQSKASNCTDQSCMVQFQAEEWFKNPFHIEDKIFKVNFRSHKNHCDYEEFATGARPLVKNKKQTKELILFLNTTKPHEYNPCFKSELNKKKTISVIRRVVNPEFEPKPVRLELTKNITRNKRLKLECRVKGFPIPKIHWQRNRTRLQPSHSRIRITQKKRKSTLVIRNISEADWGQYECIAEGVEVKISAQPYTLRFTTPRPTKRPRPTERPGKPCSLELTESYCLNGGTCFIVDYINEPSCVCATGFEGSRCEKKTSSQSSMYRQTALYTCKVGLYTKYDRCAKERTIIPR